MESLILLIIFGLGAAYFATQNTGSVHILLGSFVITGVPLYIVVIGSILLGVFISWLISMVSTFSTFFTLHGKENALRKSQKEIDTLEEKNHELEMEVAQLGGKKIEKQENNELDSDDFLQRHSFLHHIKQSFGSS